MTRGQFFHKINFGRYPKYTNSQIKEGTPKNDCVALACTESDKVIIAKYENGKWRQAHFTSTRFGGRQEIYYDDVAENVVFWTDGEPKDLSRQQNE